MHPTIPIESPLALREAAGLSQAAMARKIGVSVRLLRAWETGRRPILPFFQHYIRAVSIVEMQRQRIAEAGLPSCMERELLELAVYRFIEASPPTAPPTQLRDSLAEHFKTCAICQARADALKGTPAPIAPPELPNPTERSEIGRLLIVDHAISALPVALVILLTAAALSILIPRLSTLAILGGIIAAAYAAFVAPLRRRLRRLTWA